MEICCACLKHCWRHWTTILSVYLPISCEKISSEKNNKSYLPAGCWPDPVPSPFSSPSLLRLAGGDDDDERLPNVNFLGQLMHGFLWILVNRNFNFSNEIFVHVAIKLALCFFLSAVILSFLLPSYALFKVCNRNTLLKYADYFLCTFSCVKTFPDSCASL